MEFVRVTFVALTVVGLEVVLVGSKLNGAWRAIRAALLGGVLLVGCGGGSDEPAEQVSAAADETSTENAGPGDDTVTASAEPEATGEPSSGPEPTGGEESEEADSSSVGGETHEFADIGLTIIEPDEVPQEAAEALARYVDFAREWRKALREVEISEELRTLAAPPKLRDIEGSMDYQREHGIHYGGELIVEMEFEESSEDAVTFSGCFDGTDYVWIDDEGRHPIRGEPGNATATVTMIVKRHDGSWQVTESINEDEAC